MVIKSSNDNCFVQDIAETFANLRAENMKLNPQKCIFGTKEGKLLGNVIMENKIKSNPKRLEMRSPRTVKEVQALNGKLEALGRFLAKSAEKTYPFLQNVKKSIGQKDFPMDRRS